MTKHIGHDHISGYRFRIAAIDTETNTVDIQYDETAWSPGNTPTNRLPWPEFLEQLMLGHFEIRPADWHQVLKPEHDIPARRVDR